MTLCVVAVQHIYSLSIYLTATKACRLTGLPAETLNEELDPVCMSADVYVRAQLCVCVCACACECARVRVCLPGCVCKSTH